MKNEIYPLKFDGAIYASTGECIAKMNRDSNTTPLSPHERDDLAKKMVKATNLYDDMFFAIKESLAYRKQRYHGNDKCILMLEAIINKAENYDSRNPQPINK